MNFPKQICPYCGDRDCEADWCDVGVGHVQSGPYVCTTCYASSIGSFDTNDLDDDEKRTGWFKPHKTGSSTNTVLGRHVGHQAARKLYKLGLLDKK